MRRGREFYSIHYEDAIRLHDKGFSVNEIALQLGISYSCVYHWVKGLRRPLSGRLNEFEEFVRKNGPISAMDVKEHFPKHNELFLRSCRRGFGIKRQKISSRLGDYSTWYFVDGQEEKLRERIKELLNKYKELKEKVIDLIGGV